MRWSSATARRGATRFMRLANAYVWNFLNRFLFNLRVRDIDCAFKLFRRKLVQRPRAQVEGRDDQRRDPDPPLRARHGDQGDPGHPSAAPRGLATGAKLSVIVRALGEMFDLYRGDLGSVTHKQFAKYVVVGIFNTALDALLYLAFTRLGVFPMGPWTAKFLSFFAGTVSSFALNRYWTFDIRAKLEPLRARPLLCRGLGGLRGQRLHLLPLLERARHLRPPRARPLDRRELRDQLHARAALGLPPARRAPAG
jgi:hypothetical protein